MKNTQKIKTALSLYVNYLIHGMAIVILAQNMIPLSQQWHTSLSGVSYVISSLGIGRLLVLYISGTLSDCYGRKPFIILGILTYIPFFIGSIFSQTIINAYFFGILAGMANSFLDSGTYPTLMELFPKSKSAANIFIKIFASIGELMLPILVSILEYNKLWYGWTFVLCSILFASNLFFIFFERFPKFSEANVNIDKSINTPVTSKKTHRFTKNQLVGGISLTIYGYISMATFYLISEWLTEYGQVIGHLSIPASRILVSLYSVGSISGAIINTIIINRILTDESAIVIYTFCSLITLTLLTFVINPFVMNICSFMIGFSAASGTMQIGLTVMSKLFPNHKGKVTGIYYTAGGIASFTLPLITGWLSKGNLQHVMLLDVLIAFLGFLCSLCIRFVVKSENANNVHS